MAFSAIMMALTVVSLFGASALPTGRISLLAIASVFGAVLVSEYGPKYGFLHYVGVSLIAFLLVPKKSYVLFYVLFLGYYPMLKLWIEQIRRRWLEWIVKLLVFNVILVAAYFIFTMILMPNFNFGPTAELILRYLWLVIVVLEIVFILYDHALSVVVTYYNRYLRNKITKPER